METNLDEGPLLQIVVAPARDVVALDETDAQNEERNFLQRYASRASTALTVMNPTRSVQTRRTYLGIFIAAILGMVTKRLSRVPGSSGGSKNNPSPSPSPPSPPRPNAPTANRPDLVIECIDKLTDSINPFSNPAYSAAVDWFLKGPGKSVPLSNEDDCSWNTDFAVLFAYVVIRESLNVTTASWHSESTPIKSSSDLCSNKYHRISCDADDNIVGLHLGNGDLSGTLPTELGAFRYATRIDLYKNYGIIGTVPSELGLLSNLEYLHLHETNLSGTIPSALGKISHLKELFLDDTKLSGEMPREVCSLRTKDLAALHADCGGTEPLVSCATACCTNCYNHHRNHTMTEEVPPTSLAVISGDTLADISKCDQEGGRGSADQCRGTVMSTGIHCVYCSRPSDDQTACTTPTIAADIRRMLSGTECS